MKKLLFTSLGIVVIFLFVLSLFSIEAHSVPYKPIYFNKLLVVCLPEMCVNIPNNCNTEGIIITPDGGSQ